MGIPRHPHLRFSPSSLVKMAPTLKLYYFPLAGRAEAIRMMLNYGDLKFTEQNFTFAEWGSEWKAKMTELAYGAVPVLEVDGKVLSQSSAIQHYVANLAGLYPSDPWEAAKVEEALGLVGEVTVILTGSTNSKMTPEEKLAARKEAVDAKVHPKLDDITKLLTKAGGSFLTGPKETMADFVLFQTIGILASGFMDGVPTDLMNKHPELKVFHARMAALPAMTKMYSSVTEGPNLAFKKLPEAQAGGL